MKGKGWVPKIISNIEIARHEKNIVNVDLSILEILQSQMRRIRINV